MTDLHSYIRSNASHWQELLAKAGEYLSERNIAGWLSALDAPSAMDDARLRDLGLYMRHCWREIAARMDRDNKHRWLWLLTHLQGQASAIAHYTKERTYARPCRHSPIADA